MNDTAIKSVIDHICSKLEIPVHKGFEYLAYKGALTYYWAGCAIVLLLLTAGITAYEYRVEKRSADTQDNLPYYVTYTTALFFLLPAAVLCSFAVSQALLYHISKEAWAIDYVLKTIK